MNYFLGYMYVIELDPSFLSPMILVANVVLLGMFLMMKHYDLTGGFNSWSITQHVYCGSQNHKLHSRTFKVSKLKFTVIKINK